MTKAERKVLDAVDEAVRQVRADAGAGDWYAGYKAGASAVAVKLYDVLQKQAKAKAAGGAP